MSREIELKLSLSLQDAHRLWRCQSLKSLPRSPLRTCTLTSTYFDTPDADLWRDKFTLRLRRDCGKWIQTLKGGGAVHAGLHQRDEWEWPVAGKTLNVDLVTDTPARELLSKSKIRSSLAPQVATRFRRARCDVELAPGCVVELCLDRGEVIAGERRESICEIEFELKSGEPVMVFAFALTLLKEIPFRIEMRSKAERAFGLLFDRVPEPLRAIGVKLSPSMSPVAAMRATMWACLGQFTANEAGLLVQQDTEYLHQARVALRRLWAALSVFAHDFPAAERFPQLIQELEWLTKCLGPARDWDVFVGETLRLAAPVVTNKSAFGTLKARAQRRRQTARRQAIEAVASARYTALLLSFGQALQSPSVEGAVADLLVSARTLESVATGLIEKRYQKVLERAAQSALGDVESLHRLRIDVKKLRYVVEFFRDLYPRKKVRPMSASLARMQEHLGALNDAANAHRMCKQLRKEDDSVEVNQALSEIGHYWSTAASECLLHLPEAWRQFSAIKRFWFRG